MATNGHPMIRPLRCIDLQYSPTYSPTATKGHPMNRPDLRCIDLQYSSTYSPTVTKATL